MVDISALFTKAVVHFRNGRLERAKTLSRRVLIVDPNHAATLNLLGSIALQCGQYEVAGQLIIRAIKVSPLNPTYYYNFGLARQKEGDLNGAIDAYQRAISLGPRLAEAHYNLGSMLRTVGRSKEALLIFKRLINIQPSDPEAHYKYGRTFEDLDRPSEALAAYENAIRLRPDYAEVHNRRGITLRILGRLEESLMACKRFLQFNPDFAEAYNNLGNTLSDMGRWKEALAAYAKAIELEPEFIAAHISKAELLLLQGDYKNGWDSYVWRLKLEDMAPHKCNAAKKFIPQQWDDGLLKNQSILLLSEQGIGDEIMFASCIPDIACHSNTVIVKCNRRLESLLKRSFPYITIYEGKQNKRFDLINTIASVDHEIPIGSLPRYCRKNIRDFPNNKGYLKVDPQSASKWRSRLNEIGTNIKIGISWRGGRNYGARRTRSIPLEQWGAIVTMSDVSIVNLQYGDYSEEIKHAEKCFDRKIHSWCDLNPLSNLDEFAALISQLDLVISIDNSTVHMAGALGKDTWLALPCVPNWRWLLDRNDSPWYPSVRLFRQENPADWSGVLRELTVKLRELVVDFVPTPR